MDVLDHTEYGNNKKQNTTVLLLSAVAFCLLLLRPLRTSWILAPTITAGLLYIGITAADNRRMKSAERIKEIPLAYACVVTAFLAFVFSVVWLRTRKLVSLDFFRWMDAAPILAAALVGAIGAVPFVRTMLNGISTSFMNRTASENLENGFKLNGEDRRLLVSTAIIAISLCSMCSPLYPFNDWVDANCFFTVGKSMLYGIVPYRDLYEQKGPLLYALYALTYPVSHTSFIGAWILEIIAAYFFLELSYRTFFIICGRKSPLFILLTAAIVYSVPAFLKGGSAEEFCLPLVMYTCYVGVCCVVQNRNMTGKEALLIGLTSGAVLWVKYSLLGVYIGFILIPAWRMIRSSQIGRLIRLLLIILGGVVLAAIPVLLYFAYNGALWDLWEVYFYNNIFIYGKASSVWRTLRGLLSGAASMLTYNDATVLIVLFALISFWKTEMRAMAIYLFLTFSFAFGMIYAGGINLKYYSEILCVFVPIGLAQLMRILPQIEMKKDQRKIIRVVLPLLFSIALLGTENHKMLMQRRDEMPQYIFARTISETPNATLFNYGALDIGLFTTADIVPSTRYFCMLNLPSEEMVQEMEHYMADGVTDYIVSRGLELDSPCYELIETVYFTDDGTEYPYYLYKNKELA